MESKKYSSFAQIDRELEILKIEKEISYQKIIFRYQALKESASPQKVLNNFLGSFKTIFTGSLGSILNIVVPYVINWVINKKRDR
jgi:hypothetical protein